MSTEIMNSHQSRQKGLTLIGFIILLSALVFVAFIGMKIVPMYMDYWSVVSAMKGVQQEPGIANRSPREIKILLFNRLYVNYSSVIKEKNVRVFRGDGMQLQVKYEVRKQVIGNLEVIASFDKTVSLGSR